MAICQVIETTPILPWKKVYSTNVTTAGTSFTAQAPTITKPSTGVIDFKPPSKPTEVSRLLLKFFGTSAANQTFLTQIEGWRQTASGLWLADPLLSVTGTLGASVGVASQDVLATEYIADTLVLGTAFTDKYELISPTNDYQAFLKLDIVGYELIQVRLVRNGSSASVNALWSGY